jgi:hypothetical protein
MTFRAQYFGLELHTMANFRSESRECAFALWQILLYDSFGRIHRYAFRCIQSILTNQGHLLNVHIRSMTRDKGETDCRLSVVDVRNQ